MKLTIFSIMLSVMVISIAGISAMLYIFISSQPYLSPFSAEPLDEGWSDVNTYVSDNFTIAPSGINSERIQFSGNGIIPVINLRINPLRMVHEGEVELRVNGIYLGNLLITNIYVPIDSAVTSCSSYPLMRGGRENIIEFRSRDFDGALQYTITLLGG